MPAASSRLTDSAIAVCMLSTVMHILSQNVLLDFMFYLIENYILDNHKSGICVRKGMFIQCYRAVDLYRVTANIQIVFHYCKQTVKNLPFCK